MIEAIIIEDEQNSQELLQQMLEEYCSEIKIMGIADDVVSGISLINQVQPTIVFLDVEMPGGTGFDVLKAFDDPDFMVIFVTGYDHYAIKAIKYAAIDYLLKPVSLVELRAAIERVKSKESFQKENIRYLSGSDELTQNPKKIILPGHKKYTIIKVEDIVYLESEGPYVTFYLSNNLKYTAINPLQFYEETLPQSSFFRIHKSFLINGSKITRVETGRGGLVHLENGATLPVAVRRKPAFMKFLDKIA